MEATRSNSLSKRSPNSGFSPRAPRPSTGGTGGATTSVVTRSGGNQFHGNLYEFLRNDVFDARNFFSADVEPLNQNQFGGTIGGPITKDKLLFFGYYEGFRNRQGTTTTATVPTPQERLGDFSGMSTPLLNLAAGGVPFPGNQIPQAAINPVARNVVSLYPLGNVSPSIYRATLVGENDLDQAGGRIDYNLSNSSQIFGRYSYSGGHNINPISVRGTDVPGFPTRDDIETHAATLSSTHILSPSLTNLVRGTYLEYRVLLRPAPQPDAAERARLRLRLLERRRPGSTVFQHQRLHADRRRDHRSAQHDPAHL